MPTTRIEIEELGPGRWAAEVEAGGGSSAVRRALRSTSFDEIIMAVVDTHAELAPPAASVRPVKEVRADQAAVEAAAKVAAEREAEAVADAEHRERAAAHAQAMAAAESERLGAQAAAIEAPPSPPGDASPDPAALEVDRRWDHWKLTDAPPDLTDAPPERLPVGERTRDELIDEGEEMGLDIDRRWGDVRLRAVVEAERARRRADVP